MANGIGNLAARIMTLAEKYLNEPIILPGYEFSLQLKDVFEDFLINSAAEYIWTEIGSLDKEITDGKPFELIKSDREAGERMIVGLVSKLAEIAYLLDPFLPETSKKIIDAIVANKKPENLFPRKE